MEHTLTEELEKSFLSCLCLKPSLFDQCYITEEYFTNNQNKLMFRLYFNSYKNYKKIDLALIFTDNQKLLQNKAQWFNEYNFEIMQTEASPGLFNYYQEKLLLELKNRKMLKEINRFQTKEIDQQELIENLNKIQSEIVINDSNYFSANYIYKTVRTEGKRIHFRFEVLDKTLQFSEHDFLIIASRPSCGKTGFALNLLENLSNTYNCIYFNMEMSEKQVLSRLIGINSKIPIKFLEKPETEYQDSEIKKSAENLSKKKIKIITGVQTFNTIKNIIIREQQKEHTIVFLDYIGLIRGSSKNQSSYERISEIARELRAISMEYECTIIGIAQINRSGDNKPPLLSELKDSGELEQSAVNVILLHNENYYKKVEKAKEELQCIVAKNRNGRTGIIITEYDQFTQRIEEKSKRN